MYYIVINGDPDDAMMVAVKVNVRIQGPIYNPTYNETTATADDDQVAGLKEWFMGSTYREKGALLYYGRR